MAIMELSNTEINVVSGGALADTLGSLFGSLVSKYQATILPQLVTFLTSFLGALFAPPAA